MLGNSVRSFSPNWIRNSFDVPYIMGRPTVSFLPFVTINRFSSKVLMAEEEVTPRISSISGIVIGDQFVERQHHLFLRRVAQNLAKLFERQRLVGDEEQRFDDRFQLVSRRIDFIVICV